MGELLQLLERTRRSGTAVLISGAGEARIELRRGKVIGASAPVELPFGRLVLEAVASTGVDRPHTRAIADHAAATQILHAIRQVIGWHAGSFSFEPSSEDGKQDEDDSVEIDVQSLLMEALAGRLDEPPLAFAHSRSVAR